MSDTSLGSGLSSEAGDSAGVAGIPEDDLFHLLQNERRRNVLRYLRDRDGSVEMRDVAEQVAAWEHDTTVEQLSSDERQRVYISLYQSHLDTLEETGVIDYNQSRGVVTPTPLLDDVVRYLDLADGSSTETETDSERSSYYYLLASLVSLVLYGGSTGSISVVPKLSAIAVGLVTVLLFTVVTVGRLSVRIA
jgi:hypothetical protein